MILLKNDTAQICFLESFTDICARVEMIGNGTTLHDVFCVSVKAASVPEPE